MMAQMQLSHPARTALLCSRVLRPPVASAPISLHPRLSRCNPNAGKQSAVQVRFTHSTGVRPNVLASPHIPRLSRERRQNEQGSKTGVVKRIVAPFASSITGSLERHRLSALTCPFGGSNSILHLKLKIPLPSARPPCKCERSVSTASLSQSSVASAGGGGGRWHGGNGGEGGKGGRGPGPIPPSSGSGMVDRHEAGTSQEAIILLTVGGMSCGGCAASVRNILQSQPGVSFASVNLATESALVQAHLPEPESSPGGRQAKQGLAQTLAAHLTECGFTSSVRPEGVSSSTAVEEKRAEREGRLKASTRRVVVAWTLAAACLVGHVAHYMGAALPPALHFLHSTPFHALLSLLAMAGPARGLLAEGWGSLRRGRPNMNTLVGMGAISSFAVSCAAVLLPQLVNTNRNRKCSLAPTVAARA